jgi:hypothetical protein
MNPRERIIAHQVAMKSQPHSSVSSTSGSHAPRHGWAGRTAEDEIRHRERAANAHFSPSEDDSEHEYIPQDLDSSQQSIPFDDSENHSEVRVTQHFRHGKLVPSAERPHQPSMKDIQAALSGFTPWDPSDPKVTVDRFLRRLEQVIASLADVESGANWRISRWPVKLLPLTVSGQVYTDWIHDYLLNVSKPPTWSEARTLFLQRFMDPHDRQVAADEYRKLHQGRMHISEFGLKFKELAERRGYDLQDQKSGLLLADEILEKVNPALKRGWFDHYTKGAPSDKWKQLEHGHLDYVIEVLQEIWALQRAREGKSAGTGGNPRDTPTGSNIKPSQKRPTFHCDYHGPHSNHSTAQCRHLHGGGKSRQPDIRSSFGNQGKDSGKSTDTPAPKGSAPAPKPQQAPNASKPSALCPFCKRPGHTEERCWEKNPHLKPRKDAPRQGAIMAQVEGVADSPGNLSSIYSEDAAERYFDSYQQQASHRNGVAQMVSEARLNRDLSAEGIFGEPTVLVHLPNHTPGLSSPRYEAVELFVDTGCDLSALDIDAVSHLRIPTVKPNGGSICMANGVTEPRRGRTVEIPFTFFFHKADGTLAAEPITLNCSFELMQNCRRRSAKQRQRWGLLGRDLIDKFRQEFAKRNLPQDILLPFLIGAESPAEEQAPRQGTAALLNDNSSPAVPEEDELASIPKNFVFDISKDLEPEKHFQLDHDPEHIEEWTQKSRELLADPDVQAAIKRNADIPPNTFCNHKDAIITLALRKGSDPSKLHVAQYNIPHHKQKFVDEQVADWLAKGKIEIASQGCVVNNSLIAVPKMEGGQAVPGKFRVCVDTRKLNLDLSTNDRFPIQGIHDNFEKLKGNAIFGEIDIEQCFLQFPLHPEGRDYTAFTWKGVQYRFVGAPFGINFLPNWVHRFVNVNITRSFEWCVSFVDNLAFGSNSWEEHKQQLIALLNRCTELNLRVKTTAIKVGYSRIRVLGHIISADGLRADPRKVNVIVHWPPPKTGKEMQSFLGTCGFIRIYIRHFAELTQPLEAVKNNEEITWTDQMTRHFELLKDAVSRAPFLKPADFNRPFFIATDASQLGIGAVLYQPKGDDNDDITADNIVGIASKVLSGAALNYFVYKKELLALVYSLQKFHGYIWGSANTVVYTDHKPLIYCFIVANPSVALQNYMDIILEHDFTIRYREGLLNVLPDCLSRVLHRKFNRGPWGVPSNLKFEIHPDELSRGEDLRKQIEADIQQEKEEKQRSKKLANSSSPPKSLPKSFRANAIAHRFALPVQGAAVAIEEDDDAGEIEFVVESLDYRLPANADDEPSRTELEALRRGKHIPPENQRVLLIQEEHAKGHYGRDQVTKALWDAGWWWDNMRKDISQEISKCNECIKYVVTRRGFKPAEFITADGPWHHVQMDCQTNLKRSPEGFTTILSLVDVYTGFCLLFPLPDHSAKSVAKHLWYACALFGFPRILQSDNGTEFANECVKELAAVAAMDRRFIAAYNPRTDGKVERTFGVKNAIINKLLQGADQFWPSYLPLVQLYLNRRHSSLTQSTPFALMFNREAYLPSRFPANPAESNPPFNAQSLDDFREFQEMVRNLIHPSLARRIVSEKERMVSKVNRRHRMAKPTDFPIGSIVTILDPKYLNQKVKPKGEPAYVGRYTVRRKDRKGNFILIDETDMELNRRVPPDQIKLIQLPDGAQLPSDDNLPSYEVQRVVNHRGAPGHFEYLVKWKSYSSAQNTWEPASHFNDYQCIRDYWALKDAAAERAMQRGMQLHGGYFPVPHSQ